MFLKSLILKGFKTFADKAALEFEARGSITAIVGPNGCGKSNIIDAVRWVLGEQSSKQLRANLQEEIIFAGTEARHPLSLAEVTLLFDNADHLLPVDFAEVVVRRRIFRESESEFFLNKAPCRLKDIKDLFMDTGLGAGSYSIINQGEVDAVLLSSPEERRRIFEEVAGINRYRVRKEAAEKKLITVEQHLLRLNDLKSEIGEQLGRLEEQASRARQYQAAKARLKELEIGLCKKQLQSFAERSAEWQKKIEEFKAQIESALKEKEAFFAERQQLRMQIRNLEEEERKIREELARGASREEKRTQLFGKEGELAEKKNQLRDLEEQKRFALYEIEKANQLLEKHTVRLNQVSSGKKGVEAALVSLRQQVAEVQAQLLAKAQGPLVGEAEGQHLEQLSKHLEELLAKVDSLLLSLSSSARAATLEEFLAAREPLLASLAKVGEISQQLRTISCRVKEISLSQNISAEELGSLHKKEKEMGARLAAEEVNLRVLAEEEEKLLAETELAKSTAAVRTEEIERQKGLKIKLEEEVRKGEEEKKALEFDLSGGTQELTRRLEDSSKKREELESKMEEAEDQANQREEKSVLLREELNRAEIQIAKLEGEAENIAGRIGEEYSLSLNEVLNAPHEVAAMSKAKEEITSLRETLHALEPVNLLAIEELEKTKERMGAIEKGYLDLISSRENLKSLIFELDKRAKENFLLAVEVVGRNFSEIFAGLFTGGEAEIRLTGEEEVLKSGIEIYARPSGRKMLALSALSGGEKALTAIALLFALLRTHPTPFCFLDEVDAPLDDANVHRFAKLLADFSAQMQIVVITHNKNTMTAADIIYGVTMEEPGVSKIVSMKLSQVPA